MNVHHSILPTQFVPFPQTLHKFGTEKGQNFVEVLECNSEFRTEIDLHGILKQKYKFSLIESAQINYEPEWLALLIATRDDQKKGIECICTQKKWYKITKRPQPDGSIAAWYIDVTEEKELIFQQKSYIESLLAGLPDIIFVFNPDFTFYDLKTDRVRDLLFAPEQFIGRDICEFFPDPVARKIKDAIMALLEGKIVKPFQFQITVNHSPESFEARLFHLGNDKTVAVIRNITELKKTEEELRFSQKIYRDSINNSSDLIFVKDANHKYIVVNRAMQLHFNMTEDELLGKDDIQLLGPEYGKRANETDLICLKSDKPALFEHEIGNMVIETVKFGIDLNNGHRGIVGFSRNITENRLLEYAIRDSETYLKAIIENPFESIWTVNKNHEIEYINGLFVRAFQMSFGITLQKGMKIIDLLPPEERKAWMDRYYRVFNGEEFLFEETYPFGDDRIYVEIFASPIIIDGEIVAACYYGHDITQHKRAQEKLNAANRAKSEFLANVSHEIRTPMNSILGFSEVMLNTTTDARQKSYLRTILDSGKTLLSLINDILDLSKIEAGRLDISPLPINLMVVMEEVRQLFQQKCEEKRLEFNLGIDSNFPVTVVIDEIRLRQVLINLVGNAIKFTSKGRVGLFIKLLENKNGYVNFDIRVEDTGIGIPETDQVWIFESFSQQAGQDSRKYGGTGLGLAISKRLVELMNGEILIKSIPGKGSIFTIRFFNVKSSDDISISEEPFKWDMQRIVFNHQTILIVDDISHNRQLVTTYLADYGFDFLETHSGEAALEMISRFRPHLVLMDIRMPGMNGYETVQKIKKMPEGQRLPVVAVSASALHSGFENMGSLFNGYLHKPLQKKSLVNELRKHLEHTLVDEMLPLNNPSKSATHQVTQTPFSGGIKNVFITMFAQAIQQQIEFLTLDEFSKLLHEMTQFAREYNIPELLQQFAILQRHYDNFDFDKISISLTGLYKLLA